MSKAFKENLNLLATDPKLPTGSLYILSQMNKENLDIFRQTWPTIALERRRTIMQNLMEIAEANFEVDFDPVFLLGMGDEDAQVRVLAVKSLWEYEHPNLIAPLIHLLKTDPEVDVREAAATTLGKFIYLRELEEIDPNEATLAEEALLETIYLASEDINVRRRAIESVSFSSDSRIPPVIESAYYHESEKMQVSAIFAMGRNADLVWLPRVMEELDNPNTEIRFEAARACGELEAKDSVGKLIVLIDEEDEDIEVKEMAIWSLGRIGGKPAREVLEACLEHEEDALAIAAEDALEELNMFDSLELELFDVGDPIDFLDEDDLDLFDLEMPNGKNGDDYLH